MLPAKHQNSITILSKGIYTITLMLPCHYHRLWWKIWLEFCTNNTTVTVRPCNLTPDATVMGSILLHLGLVDICHSLASIPCYLLFGVHSLNLDQRCVWVLVWLGSEKDETKLIKGGINLVKLIPVARSIYLLYPRIVPLT